MRGLILAVTVAWSSVVTTSAKRFEKCELASVLENKYRMPRSEVKDWVCIAQYESTFNTEAINHFNWDGSKDYGLFQLSNKYWCDEDYGKNECEMPCSDLLDDDLTDDLACIKKIIRDTERWKGKGEGLTAWVAYVNRCQTKNLDEYMSECWSDPTNTNIINRQESPNKQPAAAIENEDSTSGASSQGDSPVINLVRVPIMPQYFPYFQHMVNPYGYISQHVYH